jgi:hypothetical protein
MVDFTIPPLSLLPRKRAVEDKVTILTVRRKPKPEQKQPPAKSDPKVAKHDCNSDCNCGSASVAAAMVAVVAAPSSVAEAAKDQAPVPYVLFVYIVCNLTVAGATAKRSSASANSVDCRPHYAHTSVCAGRI